VKRPVIGVAGGIFAAMLCLVTSCSSSAGTDSEPSGTIRIGTIGSFSGGTASSIGRLAQVMRAWTSWTNAHGGINGHKIKLYVKDDGGNGTTAITQVKSLIQSDKVVAIVSDASFSDSSWAPFAESAGVPVVGGQGGFAPFVTNPNFFPSTGGTAAQSYGEMVLAKANGPKVATVYCSEVPVCKGAAAANAKLAAGLGTKVVYSGFVSGSAPDYTAECQAIKSSGTHSLVAGLPVDTLIKFNRTCTEQGVTAHLILGGPSAPLAITAEPSMTDFINVDSAFPFFDSSTPATRAFQAAMKKYAPSVGAQMGPFAAYMWTGGELFAAAVKASGTGTVTPASVKKGLYALPKGTTLGGISPPLTFTKGASRPTPVNCYFVWGKKDGKLYEPQGLKTSCAPKAVVEAFNSENYK
jgi:branched-chain amino acid transport system substrate-binding protein